MAHIDLKRIYQDTIKNKEQEIADLIDRLDETEQELANLKHKLSGLRQMVQYQAEDEGLWLVDTDNITTAYLQQELRKLHHCIEQAIKEE